MTSSLAPDQYYQSANLEAALKQVPLLDSADLKQIPIRMAAASAMIHEATLGGDISGRIPPPSIPMRLKSPPQESSTLVSADSSFPPPLTSLENAVAFIRGQRSPLSYFDNVNGLPSTFYVPPSVPGTIRDPDTNRIIRESVGLYDTSLSIIALVEAGALQDAREILDWYMRGVYGRDMDQWAYPNGKNKYAFKPFDSNAFYIFDFTRASGLYTTDWQYWTPHTGPNAWLVMAITRFVDAAQRAGAPGNTWRPYLDFAQKIGNAMLRLQDPDFQNPIGETRDHGNTQGCVRYAPLGTYSATNDPFDECNAENNISAFSALSALYNLTGNSQYRLGRDRIAWWLKNATFYYPFSDQQQIGLLDPNSGMFNMGVVYNASTKRWEIQTDRNNQPIFATDSGGTWSISSLGPDLIDGLFGPGAAYRMWLATRRLMGRTAVQEYDGRIVSLQKVTDSGRLDGLDFSNLYPEEESLISPEWTGGGINAIKQLLSYYRDWAGKGQLTDDQMAGLSLDMASMKDFIARHPNAYALGPGLGGSRQGQTGFGWNSPPAEVSAMASIYGLLSVDPLAWARR